MPTVKDLIDLDPGAAAKARWIWGAANLPEDAKIENGHRDPLVEAYEEILDLLNYLREERIKNESGQVSVWFHDILTIAYQMQEYVKERL